MKTSIPIEMYSAKSGFPLPVRLRILILAHQTPEEGCCLTKTQMSKILGCRIDDVRTALKRGRRSGLISRTMLDWNHASYRVEIELPDEQREAILLTLTSETHNDTKEIPSEVYQHQPNPG